MDTLTEESVKRMLAAFMAKDLEATLAFFAEDAVMIDPHYPTPRMQGKAAIRAGMAWAFQGLEQPGFTLRRLWTDGSSGAIEIDTHHRLRGGLETRFDQVFVLETRDGLITRLQAYPSYGPHGVQSVFLGLTRLAHRLTGRRL